MIFTHPAIDPIIFSLGFIDIRWYAVSYILAFIIGSYLIKYINRRIKSKLSNKLIDDFFTWAVIGVIIGGRTGYVIFYQFENFILNPIYLLYVWRGGMSFHGGLIGMTVAIFIFTNKKNISFFLLSDLVSLVAPIGLFFGRLANFINVELVGRVTDFPIAVIYPLIDNLPRHPSQLYEAFFEGIILFVILLSIILRKNSKIIYGFLSSIFLVTYGIFRFFIEFLREPDQHLGLFFNYFTLGQFLCIPIIILGFIILFKKQKNA